MRRKILLLLSKLRQIEKTVKNFESFFPDFEITPVLFDENSGSFKNEWLYVNKSNLKRFTDEFDFSDVAIIYISFMTGEKVYFIKHAPSNIKLVWSIPGGDLYNRYFRYFGYPIVYGEDRNLKYFLGKIVRYYPRRSEFKYLLRRCSAIVSANCDYALIRKYGLSNVTLPNHIYAFAYSMDKALGPLYGNPFAQHSSQKIIIGNSASRTNNHLYVLKCLNSIKISGVSISLLMSYGDSDNAYRKKVFSTYRKVFGESVEFVTDYVPLDEFNRRLLGVTHYLYGNWRQEAVGNILTAFYLGGKVYLSKFNPLLKEFRTKGFKVYCLEEIDDSFCKSLTEDEKRNNRQLVDRLYNSQRAPKLLIEGLKPYLT